MSRVGRSGTTLYISQARLFQAHTRLARLFRKLTQVQSIGRLLLEDDIALLRIGEDGSIGANEECSRARGEKRTVSELRLVR